MSMDAAEILKLQKELADGEQRAESRLVPAGSGERDEKKDDSKQYQASISDSEEDMEEPDDDEESEGGKGGISHEKLKDDSAEIQYIEEDDQHLARLESQVMKAGHTNSSKEEDL